MTIGFELDEQFAMLERRLARLEGNKNETVLGIEDELRDRIEELENFDHDDLRYDLESLIDDVREIAYCNDDRITELEDRLNKPSLGARVLRWLREGPSIKEVATNWYAGIRRGS